MEKQDYSKFRTVSISNDVPIIFVGMDDYFQNLGINTLEELFIAYDNGVFNDRRKKFNTEIKGQTEILMSYYMETPLIADDFLETGINISDNDTINAWLVDRENTQALYRLGITYKECALLYQYCINRKEHILADKNKNAEIMEIIKEFANDKEYQSSIMANTSDNVYLKVIQNIKFKSNFFEKYLERKKHLEAGLLAHPSNNVIDRTMVQSLEAQMKFLLKARSNIDTQIGLLQTQLANVKNAGGIRK